MFFLLLFHLVIYLVTYLASTVHGLMSVLGIVVLLRNPLPKKVKFTLSWKVFKIKNMSGGQESDGE